MGNFGSKKEENNEQAGNNQANPSSNKGISPPTTYKKKPKKEAPARLREHLKKYTLQVEAEFLALRDPKGNEINYDWQTDFKWASSGNNLMIVSEEGEFRSHTLEKDHFKFIDEGVDYPAIEVTDPARKPDWPD